MSPEARSRVVFLFDVDNTLLDNDRVTADLRRHLAQGLGDDAADLYFRIFDELRTELGYADYLGTLQRYRGLHPRDLRILATSSFLVDYPFANRLYPGSLDVVEYASAFGPTVVLSDGDVVFQPRKVERSGIREAVEGRVLIYVHKERELDDVQARYPADHYVMIDDKMRILTAIKAAWGAKVTTVFARQGHYALAADVPTYPPPDVVLERIGELTKWDLPALLAAGRGRPRG